ncbi:MAG: hypothetical protein LBQ05_02425, partial [Christensenellaceae bacterium]|nr:hypothetical protein [Christensenellaceae bacterium]
MKHKLQKFIGVAAGLGILFNVMSLKQHEQKQQPTAKGINQPTTGTPNSTATGITTPTATGIANPATGAANPTATGITAHPTIQTGADDDASTVIPGFVESEYRNIKMKPAEELDSDTEILDSAKTALYKIHAHNKKLDALPTKNYSRLFLQSVIDTAGKAADETFPVRAEALGAAVYDLAFLHGELNEKTLFDVKFDLMPKTFAVVKAERRKFGKETEKMEDVLFRLSYMGEQELHEIIALLKETTATSFPADKQEYGEQITDLIANVNEYHGWFAGLKKMG